MALKTDERSSLPARTSSTSSPREVDSKSGAKLHPVQICKTAEAARQVKAGGFFAFNAKDRHGQRVGIAAERLPNHRIQVSIENAGGSPKSFVFDLTRPQAVHAYEDLMKLKPMMAEMLAGSGKGGVTPGSSEIAETEAAVTKSLQTGHSDQAFRHLSGFVAQPSANKPAPTPLTNTAAAQPPPQKTVDRLPSKQPDALAGASDPSANASAPLPAPKGTLPQNARTSAATAATTTLQANAAQVTGSDRSAMVEPSAVTAATTGPAAASPTAATPTPPATPGGTPSAATPSSAGSAAPADAPPQAPQPKITFGKPKPISTDSTDPNFNVETITKGTSQKTSIDYGPLSATLTKSKTEARGQPGSLDGVAGPDFNPFDGSVNSRSDTLASKTAVDAKLDNGKTTYSAGGSVTAKNALGMINDPMKGPQFDFQTQSNAVTGYVGTAKDDGSLTTKFSGLLSKADKKTTNIFTGKTTDTATTIQDTTQALNFMQPTNKDGSKALTENVNTDQTLVTITKHDADGKLTSKEQDNVFTNEADVNWGQNAGPTQFSVGAGATFTHEVDKTVKGGKSTTVVNDTLDPTVTGNLQHQIGGDSGPTVGIGASWDDARTKSTTRDEKGAITDSSVSDAKTLELTPSYTTAAGLGVAGDIKKQNTHTVDTTPDGTTTLTDASLNRLGATVTGAGNMQYTANTSTKVNNVTTTAVGDDGKPVVTHDNSVTHRLGGGVQNNDLRAYGIKQTTVENVTGGGNPDKTVTTQIGAGRFGVTAGSIGVDAILGKSNQVTVGADGSKGGDVEKLLDLSMTLPGKGMIGFGTGSGRSYSLTLPKGTTGDVALPFDSAAAAALPKGTSFSLTANGRIAVHGNVEGIKGGISNEKQVTIKVDRGAGSIVNASIDMANSSTKDLGGEARFNEKGFVDPMRNAGQSLGTGSSPGLNIRIGASVQSEAAKHHVASFSLDLSKPNQKAAYDQMMRGNLAPAQQLTAGQATVTDTNTHSSEAKVDFGVSYHKYGAAMEMQRNNIDPSDPRIQSDATRKAFTQQMAGQGKDVRWIEKGGAVELGASPDFSAPVGGGISVAYGFSARKAMEWRSLSPQLNGAAQGSGPAMTAEDVLARSPGSEFSMRGVSQISGRTGILGGWQAGVPGVTVGAGVGFEVSKGKSVDMGVTVKRLDGQKVEVRVDSVKGDQTAKDFSARLGVTVSGQALVAAGGSALGALAKNPMLAKVADLKKSMSIEYKAGSSSDTEKGKGLIFQLDLSKPDARAAYEKLVKGNPDGAIDRSANADSGVQLQSTLDLQSSATEKHSNLHVGPVNIFNNSTSQKDTAVTITDAQTVERMDTSIVNKNAGDIFGRRRGLEVDAVSLRTASAPNGQKYFRFNYNESERYTSRGQLEQRRELAKELGATPAHPDRVDEGKNHGTFLSFISGRRNDYGKVDTNIEVFISQPGIANVRKAGRDGALNAYGQSMAEEKNTALPKWADPDTAVASQARQILDQYRAAPEPNNNNNDDPQPQGPTRDDFRKQYEQAFGKQAFKQDVKEYARAAQFGDAIQNSGTDTDPSAWNKSFGDMAKRMGFNFFTSLAALDRMAGPQEVKVNQFSMKGGSVDIDMKSDGSLAPPKFTENRQAIADRTQAEFQPMAQVYPDGKK